MGKTGNIKVLEYRVGKYRNELKKVLTENHLLRTDDRNVITWIRNIHIDLSNSLIGQIAQYSNTYEDDLYLEQWHNILEHLLDNVWDTVQYPLFDWFRHWRKSINKSCKDSNKVERRKLVYKLTKIFKIIHKFYYKIIEVLLNQYNTAKILPAQLKSDLNLPYSTNKQQEILETSDPKLILVIQIVYRCLFYLGKAQYQIVLLETQRNRFTFNQFKRAERYFIYSSLILPSYGKPFEPISEMYFKSGDSISATYYSILGLMARVRNNNSINMLNFIINSRSENIKNISHNGMEIMDFNDIFLALLKEQYFQTDYNLVIINKMQRYLGQKLKILVSQEAGIKIIFKIVVIIIGFFHETADRDGFKVSYMKLALLNDRQNSYLNWSFDIFSLIICEIMDKQCTDKLINYEYLGIVRIIMCWIKSNKIILQFSHRNEIFCKTLAYSVNELADFDEDGIDLYAERKPSRPYFFQEDIMLREFSCIHYVLSDFNDKTIFNSKDVVNRVMGYESKLEKLSSYSETLLRLTAIVTSIIKFLSKNNFGIKWNPKSKLYEYNQGNFLSASNMSIILFDKINDFSPEHKKQKIMYKGHHEFDDLTKFKTSKRNKSEVTSTPVKSQLTFELDDSLEKNTGKEKEVIGINEETYDNLVDHADDMLRSLSSMTTVVSDSSENISSPP